MHDRAGKSSDTPPPHAVACGGCGEVGFAVGAAKSPSHAVESMAVLLRSLSRETVGLSAAMGRVLGEDVAADRDSPAFDYSAMDGYAVSAAAVAGAIASGGRIPVRGEARIGLPSPELPTGPCAIRIATGAPMPAAADAVIKREDVHEHESVANRDVEGISVRAGIAGVRAGDHLRRRGENARGGEIVLRAGCVLTASSLGTLAAIGRLTPSVQRRVRVAVISTGDELVDVGVTPGMHQIRDSNRETLRAVLASRAWIQVVGAEHVRDDDSALDAAIQRAAASADAIVLTGGVSAGHRDPVRPAIERAGGRVIFHGVPQRPGRPMLGAAIDRAGESPTLPVFGLPGNPLSTMVTCTRIVLPTLAVMAGVVRSMPAPLVRLASHDGRTLDLWWHRLVRLRDDGMAELVDGRGSGDIIAGGRSDGFIEVPPGVGASEMPAFAYYPWPA